MTQPDDLAAFQSLERAWMEACGALRNISLPLVADPGLKAAHPRSAHLPCRAPVNRASRARPWRMIKVRVNSGFPPVIWRTSAFSGRTTSEFPVGWHWQAGRRCSRSGMVPSRASHASGDKDEAAASRCQARERLRWRQLGYSRPRPVRESWRQGLRTGTGHERAALTSL